MFELVELDPETGEEDHLIETGSFKKLEKTMTQLLEDMADEWDTYDSPWSVYCIRPAT